MRKVLLFNPGVGSLNKGDEIISDAVTNNIDFCLQNNFVTSISTHTPLNYTYVKHLKNYDLKFVCGSNLLMGKMNGLFRQWDITPLSISAVKECILVGVGWWQQNDKPNLYTKWLYRKILNKNYLHSVRDEYTKKMLESIGVKNVINTGCCTMWGFTKEFCNQIPTKKSDDAIFTITDYNEDEENDSLMIKTIIKNYKNVYFWPQGEKDYDYILKLGFNNEVKFINSDLKSYDDFLSKHDCDYIGTRLHGGIRALQHKKRSIIISIDNRAREKKKDFNIPCIERNEMSNLNKMINSSFKTEINIPIENINKWKSQFEKLDIKND